MKWVTRSRVHVDRVACPWLIKRFVDADAEFLFVSPAAIEETARRESAIPFDVPGVELGHHDGHCSFVTIMRHYRLRDRALERLARIVDAADTDALDGDPLAAGLEAIATGFGLVFPDDRANLAHQFAVYDALYAWCRLEMAKNPPPPPTDEGVATV